LLRELELYNPEMLDKARLVAITKCDMLDDELLAELRAEVTKSLPRGLEVEFISSVTGLGVTGLKDKLWASLEHENRENK
jgi:GTP-binding protein